MFLNGGNIFFALCMKKKNIIMKNIKSPAFQMLQTFLNASPFLIRSSSRFLGNEIIVQKLWGPSQKFEPINISIFL